jgi:phosphatidylglycerophosphate synthase
MIAIYYISLITFASQLGENIEVLIVLFLWTIPAQLLIGFLPQESVILFAAQRYSAVTVTGIVIGALLITEVLNYHIIKAVGRIPYIQSLIQRESFRKTVQLFNRAPFSATVIAAFTPLPFLPVRILAPLSGFPLAKYIGAVAGGRIPRIYLIALLGFTLSPPVWVLVLLTIVPLIYIANNVFNEWKQSLANQLPVLRARFRSVVTIPNLLTASRLLIILPVIVYAIAYEYVAYAFLGIVFMGITDMLDGYLARKFNLTTQLGQYFDYAIDLFCMFVIGFLLSSTTDLPVQFVYFIIARETIQIGCAAYLAGLGITTHSSRVATISGFLVLATYSMYLLELPFREVLLGVTILSLIVGTLYYGHLYMFSLKSQKKAGLL